jgi:hypothetical protein
MPLPMAFSSVTSLVGALRVNYSFPAAAQEDLGGKCAQLVSYVNQLTVQVSYIQSLLTSANLSAVGFSALSATAFSNTPTTITNFTSN